LWTLSLTTPQSKTEASFISPIRKRRPTPEEYDETPRCGRAVEPVIGHNKAERTALDAVAVAPFCRPCVLAAAGFNFALLLRWPARLLRAVFHALSTPFPIARLA
jgi:hypothetical protein